MKHNLMLRDDDARMIEGADPTRTNQIHTLAARRTHSARSTFKEGGTRFQLTSSTRTR